MTLFKVKAGTLEGKVLYKEVEAASHDDLVRRLGKEGLYPIDIRARGALKDAVSLFAGKGIRHAELLVFNHGLATLLKAGLPVVDSLETLRKTIRNPGLAEAVAGVINGIKAGSTLSEALGKYPEAFPPLYTASIGAGERTGDLIPAINGFIQYQKRMEAIRKKVVSSATYPLVLAFASAVVVVFLLIYVVPSFTRIYLDVGTDLPAATRALIAVTGFLKGRIIFAAAALSAAIVGMRFFFKTGDGRARLDKLKLSLPMLGEIYHGYAVSKFSRTLGTVLKSGLPLVQALQLSDGVLNNTFLQAKLERIIKKTKEGGTVSDAMDKEGFMPELSLRMFSAGERSANLPEVLSEIADFNEEDLSHRVEILTDLIEPALMVIMGLVIGTIVVLMYLPIFQLGARM